MVGDDVRDEERAAIEEAARMQSLHCEHYADVWAAHKAMLAQPPAAAVLLKRLSGPCDAFLLLSAPGGKRDERPGWMPVILLGASDERHIRAAWNAGVDCCLTRPIVEPDELAGFLKRLLEVAEG